MRMIMIKNNHLYTICLVFCFLLSFFSIKAQALNPTDSLIQLSGLVLDGATDELLPVPFTNVYAEKETRRGTSTDFQGFFTLVAERGETIVFSSIGYKDVRFVVPDTLTDNRYSIVQLMTQDTINLPETVVFPWPSKEHFKIEFLAMDVTHELQRRASENIAQDILEERRSSVLVDGNESADYYLRQQANNYYHYGQFQPMKIFDPIAWGKFFKSWKDGDYKKKKDK